MSKNKNLLMIFSSVLTSVPWPIIALTFSFRLILLILGFVIPAPTLTIDGEYFAP